MRRKLPTGFGAGYLFGILTMLASIAISIPIWLYLANPAQPTGDPVQHYIADCGSEDGGPILPCVWREQTPEGEWILYTEPR